MAQCYEIACGHHQQGQKDSEAGSIYGEACGGWMIPKDRLKPHKTFKDGEWWLPAATRGEARTMNQLGFIYEENGRGVEQNYQRAAEWYRKAADEGDPTGMSNLAILYRKGRRVDKDGQRAVFWAERALEAGRTGNGI